MIRLLTLILVVYTTVSCSEKDFDELTFVCEGIQATIADNNFIKDELFKVKKTYHLSNRSTEAPGEVQILSSDKKVKSTDALGTKQDWILHIDESRKITEDSYKEKILGKLYESNSSLKVTRNKITALQEQKNTLELDFDSALQGYKKYSIEIDRTSGFFRELNIESPIKNDQGTTYRIETKGHCKKGSRKS